MIPTKTFILILLGNIIEYYDFLLFAHLGILMTPLFFPNNSSSTVHLISLFLFGLAFFMRPLGGWIFGKVGDTHDRKTALVRAMFWSIFPALGLALLPSYDTIGFVAPILFAFFRLSQGIALGGEYPNAGTYIMQSAQHRRGLLSGILAASGTIGSLLGFAVAFYCLSDSAPTWAWRAAYMLAAVLSATSYVLRKFIKAPAAIQKNVPLTSVENKLLNYKRLLTTTIGFGAGATHWLAVSYSNFYVTKILQQDVKAGLLATFVALIGYFTLTPLCGFIADRVGLARFLRYANLAIVPLSPLFFYWLSLGAIWQAQLGLALLTASVSAPTHAIMNRLFPEAIRGRNVALFFMLGLSAGGMLPSLSGYLVMMTGYDLIPAMLCSVLALCSFLLFSTAKSRGLLM